MAGRYDGLRQRLAATTDPTVRLTFDQLDEAVDGLPASARSHRAWWANERDGQHIQAAAWSSAGYQVATVELGDHVVFSRVAGQLARMDFMGIDGDDSVVRGTLELRDGMVVADEGAQWLIEDFVAVLPDGSSSRRVRPTHGAAFLVACWFSLRGAYTGGRLVDVDGRMLTRAEGLSLVDAYAGVGDRYPAGAASEPDASSDDAGTGIVAQARDGGDAPEQRAAEALLIAAVARRLGVPLRKQRLSVEGATVEVDGYCDEPAVLVEAWAHQGPPKPAQKHKVMADALKLVWIERTRFPEGATKVLAMADPGAARHFTGSSWMAVALRHLNVDVMVIELPPDVQEGIAQAQQRQFR